MKTRVLAGRINGGVLMKDTRGGKHAVMHAVMHTPYIDGDPGSVASVRLFTGRHTSGLPGREGRAGHYSIHGRVTGYGFEGDKFVVTFSPPYFQERGRGR